MEKKKAKGESQESKGKETARRKLAEMNLLEDFLFGSVVAHPAIGERFVRILLKTVFGREFGHVTVTAQKVLYGSDTNLRGARLDVWLEPEIETDSEERATVYDVEPDRNDSKKDIIALPRRVRFYHGKMIARELESGAEFDQLKNIVILMIMPYDPFGLDRMAYTIKNGCIEAPEMPYDDGACTLFLYTKGTVGVPNEEVKQMLHYMEESTYENAVNNDLREVHDMVETVKRDPETSLAYWKMMHKKIREEREAEARGEARGIAEGELRKLISLVCRKMKSGQNPEKIAEDLMEEPAAIEEIYHVAIEFAPDYDVDRIFAKLNDNRQEQQDK